MKQCGKTVLALWGTNLGEGDDYLMIQNEPGDARCEKTLFSCGGIWTRKGDDEPHKGVLRYTSELANSWDVEIACTAYKTLKLPSNVSEILQEKGGPAQRRMGRE